MEAKEHWNQVYRAKGPRDVSWYQARPSASLRLIEASGAGKEQGVIDVGGGDSVLVDFLLDAGFKKVAVLDISETGLRRAKDRLGARAGQVDWFEADITDFVPPRQFGLWHDRAVFHFLTRADMRRKYVETLMRTLAPGGHAIIATFAKDGPPQCSGLDVARYDADSMRAEIGPRFRLVEDVVQKHITPWQSGQSFRYFRFIAEGSPRTSPRQPRADFQ